MKNILIIFLISFPLLSSGFSDGKAGFLVEINGEINPYNIYSVFLLPGKESKVKSEQSIILTSEKVKCTQVAAESWVITSPEKPGAYSMRIKASGGEEMRINVLVLTPISEKKGEYLNGYRIGNYPLTPLKGNPIYNRPVGFFEVNNENADLLLTPHFRLRQFLCKQQSDYPKYVIIRERLLLKLEYLLTKVNEKYTIETFGFISGYRTPYYNKIIKNVAYSRHVYGGASDIYIDQNKDGQMDDLNGDGVIDERDVRIFYNMVDEEFNKVDYDKYKGGLGFYKKNSVHSGFIHVDVRGWKARW